MNRKYQQNRSEGEEYILDDDENEQDGYQENRNVKKLTDLPVQQSQSDSEEILMKIDNLLDDNLQASSQSKEQKQRINQEKQAHLNFKINQLQRICYTLSEANRRLSQKLQENCYIPEKDNKTVNIADQSDQISDNKTINNNILNISTESNNMYNNDELTLMQGEFGQIENLLKEYKQQLIQSEKNWLSMRQQKDEEIDYLKRQLVRMLGVQEEIGMRLGQKEEEVQMLKRKNEELLVQLEGMEELRMLENYSDIQSHASRYDGPFNGNIKKYPSYGRFDQDYRFSESIERELQIMIKKLMRELSLEKRNNKRLGFEIKRLNYQLIEMEKKIKSKNDVIYQLEMRMISWEKNGNGGKGSNSNKYSYQSGRSRVTNQLKIQQNRVQSPPKQQKQIIFMKCEHNHERLQRKKGVV